jgi:beta-lactam-binding protein with PASTA domain
VNVDAPGVLRGQVLSQSPAAGSKLPSGSEVIIEATAGSPPPKAPVLEVRGLPVDTARSRLEAGGWQVTIQVVAAPPNWLIPTPDPAMPPYPPSSGQVWRVSPNVGVVSPDGNVVLNVQP